MKKNILNPKGPQNPLSGSKVTAILLKGWILPIGGASAGEGLHLQPVQQACIFSDSEYDMKSMKGRKHVEVHDNITI